MTGPQLSLPTVTDAETWAQILDEIREIVRARGPKEVAFALDISGSDLSNAIAERNRTELKLRHLPYFLHARLNDELPRIIVEHCGLSLSETRPLTAAERLERLEAAALRSGAAGQAILEDAFGPRRRR